MMAVKMGLQLQPTCRWVQWALHTCYRPKSEG
jgi:hypothetical protein